MDENVTIGSMKQIVKDFCEARDWDQFHNPKDLAIGISTEANELLDIFRFQTEGQMKQMMLDETTRSHIEEELADTLFFILRFAQMNDIDLHGALTHKVRKNGQRYTVERSKGNNAKIINTCK